MSPAHSNDLAATSSPTSLPAAGDGVADKVADAMEKVSIQDEQQTHESLSGGLPQPIRPFITYSRAQCLALHKSPLVRLPDGMPPLKDWFGDWNEQVSSKKEPEPSTAPSTARDRRFRRDQEDGEPLPRATFRSGLSQPSQMGNFKHQSIRTTDRDRDRDGDKDRERDRDKEGHERLRSLSDKYDRDRLGLPATAANLRTRERDSAPHLTPGTSKLAAQSPLGPGAARRADGREAPRRKLETSEDWRRGRDDRADGLRRDRDDRDRPRSRVRDSSRNRRDPSPLRRERDREDRDRYRGRDNDDHPRRKETKDDPPRRDRDHDRETTDDTRRWRDDGKREERLARRERDKDKDKGNGAGGEAAWDHDRPRDRDRWNIVDDREGRSKRQGGRERRAASREDRDKDERRDKEKEREKEKEPAWMDTYIPASNSSGGILGGKLADGELDSIQTWKKGMKEKEQKEKLSEVGKGQAEGDSIEPGKSETTATTAPQMDEIQLFKMLMRREDDKKKLDAGSEGFADTPAASSPAPDPLFVALAKAKEQPGRSGASTAKDAFERDAVSTATHGQSHASTLPQPSNSPAPHFSPESPSDGRRTLLSIVTPSTADHALPGAPKPSTPLESPQVVGSRFFPNPSPSEGSSVHNQLMEKTASGLIKSPIPAQFNPPPGSRLLSFGSRTPSVTSSAKGLASVNHPPGLSQPPQQQPGMHSLTSSPFLSDVSRMGSEHDTLNGSMRGPTIDISRSQRGFSPFDHQARSSFSLEDQEAYAHAEALRRQSVVSMGERSQFGIPPESASPYSDLSGVNPMTGQGLRLANHSPSFDGPLSSNGPGGSQYPQSKGSRFAKFFDGKTRDAQASGMVKGQTIIGHSSPSPLAVRRHETGSTNDIFNVANGDGRTMEDIFAMLQSSTQGQRLNTVNTLNQLSSVNNGSYGQAPSNMHTVHHPQQNFTPARNLDVLYDNRLDDRNFVPDGMVPGLRSIPPPRRENLFHDQIDDSMAFSVHARLQPQRNMDQMYPSPSQMQSLYLHQGSNQRNNGLPPQQPFRNGTSPIPVQNPQLQVIPQQRLPPGLANLGGRPPHEPSQFLGSPMGMSSGGIPGNGPTPPFNNFSGNAGYSAGPQMRGPPPGPHQLQNPLGHNPMVGLGHPNKMDLRGGPAQAQLLGMGGVAGGGLRGPGSGFGPQQGPNVQLQAQHQAQQLTMRQQQQQLPPHMMPHLLPPHLQQQGPPGATSQPAHDIMALLMGGPPRN